MIFVKNTNESIVTEYKNVLEGNFFTKWGCTLKLLSLRIVNVFKDIIHTQIFQLDLSLYFKTHA